MGRSCWPTDYFFLSWIGQGISQYYEVQSEAQEHGVEFEWSDYRNQFFSATFENWQSEFLQLAVQCVFVQSVLQSRWFRADSSADKEDVKSLHIKLDKILEGRNEH